MEKRDRGISFIVMYRGDGVVNKRKLKKAIEKYFMIFTNVLLIVGLGLTFIPMLPVFIGRNAFAPITIFILPGYLIFVFGVLLAFIASFIFPSMWWIRLGDEKLAPAFEKMIRDGL